jgi:RNA polymerase sigma-70 factor, ECF subfamily
MPRGSPAVEVPWIEPYPDSAQRLPARQRAVLLLRDVLGWSAGETAQALKMTVASANSALQRARLTLEKRVSKEEIVDRAAGDIRQREAAERYAAAWENADLDGLTALLTKDATMNMPPYLARIFHSAVRLHEPRGLWPFKS